MPCKKEVYQSYNAKKGAWVKYKLVPGGTKWLNVKQKNPKKPFKGVPKRGKKR